MISGLKHRFTRVYQENLWVDSESRSGAGSRLDSHSVTHAIAALDRTVREYPIRSIADVPCGDFNWMPLFLGCWPEIDYTGFDIVEDAIAHNRYRAPTRRFFYLDITQNVPPRVDLIFCKDLVNHLTFSDVQACLNNLKRSGSTYLLLSNNFDHGSNTDVGDEGGNSRLLNITLPPFSCPPPLWHDGYMALWSLADLPEF